jgi:NTE family protein
MVRGLKYLRQKQKLVMPFSFFFCFPGIISPYEINGEPYSDGGILNHFPTDILQGQCDNIIGVSPIQK